MLFLLITLFVTGIQAQDIITLKSGEDINAKVTKLGDTEIEYKKWDNQDGPIYSKKLSEVFSVKYQNGQKDVFNVQPEVAAPVKNTAKNTPHLSGRMEASRGDLYLNGQKLSDYEIAQYCGADGLDTYKSACAQRVSGTILSTFGWIDFGVGLAFMIVGIAGDDEDFLEIGAPIFASSQIFLPLGLSLKGAGNGRINWLADDYNSHSQVGDNIDLMLSPSVMRTNLPSMGTQYALGAALTLKF